jgi:hypothetical protein
MKLHTRFFLAVGLSHKWLAWQCLLLKKSASATKFNVAIVSELFKFGKLFLNLWTLDARDCDFCRENQTGASSNCFFILHNALQKYR